MGLRIGVAQGLRDVLLCSRMGRRGKGFDQAILSGVSG